MTKKKRWLLSTATGLAVIYVTMSAWASKGIVVDEAGKPIKGAVILAYWTGDTGWIVQPHSMCFGVETATTNEKGEFTISTFSGSLNPVIRDRTRQLSVIAEGHRLTPATNRDELRLVMGRRTGTPSEQFAEIADRNTGGGCGNDYARVPFLKVMYAEMVKLAATREEKDMCDSLLFSLESAEFGRTVAEERSRQRYDAKVIRVTK